MSDFYEIRIFFSRTDLKYEFGMLYAQTEIGSTGEVGSSQHGQQRDYSQKKSKTKKGRLAMNLG